MLDGKLVFVGFDKQHDRGSYQEYRRKNQHHGIDAEAALPVAWRWRRGYDSRRLIMRFFETDFVEFRTWL